MLGGAQAPLRVAPALLELAGRHITAVSELSRDDPALARARARVPAEAFIDLGDRLLSPAFINAHTHLSMIALRGLGGDAGARENVVEQFFFEIESALEPADIRAFTRLGAFECLLSGTAVVWDHYYAGLEVAAGLRDAGLAGVVAPTLQDLEGPGADAWRAQLEATRALDDDASMAEAGVLAALGPHATDTVSPTLWRAASELAGERALPLHAHLAQSYEEYARALERHGCSPLELLTRERLLDGPPRSLLVHGLFLTDRDLARLDPQRHVLGLCPYSQLQFGFLADVAAWTRARVPWIVATDAAACNDVMGVQRELRLVAGTRAHAIVESPVFSEFRRTGALPDARAIRALRAQRQRERAPLGDPGFLLSRVWSVPGDMHPKMPCGRIEAGRWAHLAVWDLEHPALWPGSDPLRALTHGDATAALDGLMIGGRWIGERGRFHASVREQPSYRAAQREARARLRGLLDRLGLPSPRFGPLRDR